MTILRENIGILLPLIALLSICALASPKASLSAIFLFFESVLLNIYLATFQGSTSIVFGASILLTFFTMITIGNNYYFEVSFKKSITKPPKLNIAMGIFLLALFLEGRNDFFTPRFTVERLYYLNLNYDGLSMVTAGFSLFAILVSTLIIFDMKNPKPGDHT